MPPWLTGGNPTLYFLIGSAAVIGAVQWWRTRQRKYAVATGIALVFLAGVFALDRVPRRQRHHVSVSGRIRRFAQNVRNGSPASSNVLMISIHSARLRRAPIGATVAYPQADEKRATGFHRRTDTLVRPPPEGYSHPRACQEPT